MPAISDRRARRIHRFTQREGLLVSREDLHELPQLRLLFDPLLRNL